MEVWLAPEPLEQATHWEETWTSSDAGRSISALLEGRDTTHAILARYFTGSGQGRALDHGCGFARVGALLTSWNWSVVGVDFVLPVLKVARDLVPEVPVIRADVRHLPFKASSFDGAISLGVVEHLREGPAETLAELRRVLRPGALAVVSVPFDNPVRRVTNAQGSYRRYGYDVIRGNPTTAQTSRFYQYSFSVSEFSRELARAGFLLRKTIPYGVARGLQELPGGRRIHGAARAKAGRNASADAGHRQGRMERKAIRFLEDVYFESDRSASSQIFRGGIGRVAAHMMAYVAGVT